MLGGRLLDGAQGNAGHIGHVVVEPDGRPCVCGGRGCLEAEASGLAIEADHRERAGPRRLRRRYAVAPGPWSGGRWPRWPACSTSTWPWSAGSVALGFGAAFFDAAQAEIELRSRLDFSRPTRIIPAGLGTDGPLVGAAAVGRRALTSLGAESR